MWHTLAFIYIKGHKITNGFRVTFHYADDTYSFRGWLKTNDLVSPLQSLVNCCVGRTQVSIPIISSQFRARWLSEWRVRLSTKRTSFESGERWASSCTPCCLRSLSCKNDYLALVSGGHLCINCCVLGAFQRSYGGVRLTRSAME